jgi:hypothetical protein
MIGSAPARTQELHSRVGDGILVRLVWRADDDDLFVTVADSKEDVEFCVEVRDRARALDVFHHPFAYAAQYGVQATPSRPHVRVAGTVSA